MKYKIFKNRNLIDNEMKKILQAEVIYDAFMDTILKNFQEEKRIILIGTKNVLKSVKDVNSTPRTFLTLCCLFLCM